MRGETACRVLTTSCQRGLHYPSGNPFCLTRSPGPDILPPTPPPIPKGNHTGVYEPGAKQYSLKRL